MFFQRSILGKLARQSVRYSQWLQGSRLVARTSKLLGEGVSFPLDVPGHRLMSLPADYIHCKGCQQELEMALDDHCGHIRSS